MSAVKTLIVGIDGLRIDDALSGDAMPRLARLASDGSFAHLTMEVPTISGPGWSSLLTGAPHAAHGVFDNSFHGHTLASSADVLSRAYFADQSTTTFAASGWPPLVDPSGPGPVIATRDDQRRTGTHRVIVRDGETYGYRWADAEITAWALLALDAGAPDVSFVYLGEVDEAGHLYGGISSEYAAAMARVDAHLGRILARVGERAREHGEAWQVAVTTDHGHLDEGGHGGDEPVVRRSFLAAAEIRAGGVAELPIPEGTAPHDVADLVVSWRRKDSALA